MSKKILIGLLIVLILSVIGLMIRDLFFLHLSQENPYELNTDSIKKYDTSLICYKEVFQIESEMDELNGITIDNSDNIIVTGSKVIVFNKDFKEIKSFKLGEIGNCVDVNSLGEIFMGVQNHIEVWNFQGDFIRRWDTKNPESILSGIAIKDSAVSHQ